MKIYAIKNADIDDRTIGYFMINNRMDECCIELCEDVDEWDVPFILDTFVRHREYSIGYENTLKFIRQRIVPQDRQNLGSILRDNGLEEYDEIRLFIISDGRCAQDECHIVKISEEELPEYIQSRLNHYILSVCQVNERTYIISFQNGEIAMLDIDELAQMNRKGMFERLIAYIGHMEARAEEIGNYISVGGRDCISSELAYGISCKLPVNMETLQKLVLKDVMSTADVMEALECSRQNVNDLVKRGRLTPLKANNRNMIFSRSEVAKIYR